MGAGSAQWLITDNAANLNLVKISNDTPTILPWYFSYLGPFKYTIFASRLEAEEIPPNPMVGGMRINFKPSPTFEMGMAFTAMFGGQGVPGLTFSDVVKFLGFQSPQNANQMAAFDFRWRLPWLRNTSLYFEWGGDDSGSGFDSAHPQELIFKDQAFLLGAYIPDLMCDGRTDLRIEWTTNAHRVDSTPGFWYGHYMCQSGYTQYGMRSWDSMTTETPRTCSPASPIT